MHELPHVVLVSFLSGMRFFKEQRISKEIA